MKTTKILGMLALIVICIAIGYFLRFDGWTQEEIRSSIITKIESEAPESFLVTGSYEINASIVEENSKSFIIPVLFLPVPVSMGKTTTNIRIPGKVSYGFNIGDLKAEDIVVAEDGLIEVALPELSIYSVEPHLDQAEIETEVGWARMHSRSGQENERMALSRVNESLKLQGSLGLQSTTQPKINTSEALEKMLRPVVEALGMESPRFRFVIGNEDLQEPGPRIELLVD